MAPITAHLHAGVISLVIRPPSIPLPLVPVPNKPYGFSLSMDVKHHVTFTYLFPQRPKRPTATARTLKQC